MTAITKLTLKGDPGIGFGLDESVSSSSISSSSVSSVSSISSISSASVSSVSSVSSESSLSSVSSLSSESSVSGISISSTSSESSVSSTSSVSSVSSVSGPSSSSISSESSQSSISSVSSLSSASSQSLPSGFSISSKSFSYSSKSFSVFSSLSSLSSLVSSSFSVSPYETIQARITSDIKSAFRLIRIANGYNYDISAVEEARKKLDLNNRDDFILILDCEPMKDPDSRVIERLKYSVWFFPNQNDELIGDPRDPTRDYDTEVTHYMRNIHGDMAKSLMVDRSRGGLASLTEFLPGEPANYIDEKSGMILPGYWSEIMVWTNIDAEDPYNFRKY